MTSDQFDLFVRSRDYWLHTKGGRDDDTHKILDTYLKVEPEVKAGTPISSCLNQLFGSNDCFRVSSNSMLLCLGESISITRSGAGKPLALPRTTKALLQELGNVHVHELTWDRIFADCSAQLKTLVSEVFQFASTFILMVGEKKSLTDFCDGGLKIGAMLETAQYEYNSEYLEQTMRQGVKPYELGQTAGGGVRFQYVGDPITESDLINLKYGFNGIFLDALKSSRYYPKNAKTKGIIQHFALLIMNIDNGLHWGKVRADYTQTMQASKNKLSQIIVAAIDARPGSRMTCRPTAFERQKAENKTLSKMLMDSALKYMETVHKLPLHLLCECDRGAALCQQIATNPKITKFDCARHIQKNLHGRKEGISADLRTTDGGFFGSGICRYPPS